MRKEILFAIIAGSVLGLVIGFGIWRANAALKNVTTTSATPSPSTAPTREFGITLAKPEDKDVVGGSPLTFTGITGPNAWVVLSTDTNDYFFQALADGSFSQDAKLNPGVNEIVLTALADTGERASTSLAIVYSSEFASAPTSPNTGTAEGDIRQKVINKVEEVLNKPKAYLGTVTDIAAQTLQIKTDSSEIEQISTAAGNITVVKMGKPNKEIKLTDIAIGDFIAALGYKNGNDVLNARRILTMSPPEAPNLDVLYGTVTKVEKKDIIVRPLTGGEEKTVVVDKNTDISREKGAKQVNINLVDINEKDLVIAVISKDTAKARTVLVVTPASP